MNLLAEAMSGLGAVLLQVAAALLLEELTFGGLVRLLVAPRPETGEHAGSTTTKKEKENDRIEAVADGRGSALAGCRFGNSAVWTLASHSHCPPQGRRRRNSPN